MIGKIKTVDDVKKKIKVESFDNLSEKQEKKLQKLMPKMEKEVALQVIQEMPNYIDFCKEFVSGMQNICNDMIKESDKSRISAIEGYQLILNDLEEELHRPHISNRRRDKITSQMMLVAKCISDEGDKHRQFMQKVSTKALAAGGVALGFIGAIVLAVITRQPPEFKK